MDRLPPTAPPDPQVDGTLLGTVVGERYRVVSELGQGGMGAVYEVLHVAIEKRFALKVLHPSFAGDATLRERFLREAKAAARVRHPNIVDITDFGTTPGGLVFIVMELLEGQDLAHLLAERGALPWSEARPLLRQICGALAAAHEQGIIHRDIKPENVFLVPRPLEGQRVKLVDFGIAKLLHERNQPKLTAAGMVHGTPGFIAPEQIYGGPVDHRADIYAVGVLAYKMVTGSAPFPGTNVLQVLTRQLNETPLSPSQAAEGVPPELDRVLLTAMAREADQRYSSMEELDQALDEVPLDPVVHRATPAARAPEPALWTGPAPQAERPAASPSSTVRVGRSGAWVLPVVALALGLGVACGTYLLLSTRSPGEPTAAPKPQPQKVAPAAPPAGQAASQPAADAAVPEDAARAAVPPTPKVRRPIRPRHRPSPAKAAAPAPRSPRPPQPPAEQTPPRSVTSPHPAPPTPPQAPKQNKNEGFEPKGDLINPYE